MQYAEEVKILVPKGGLRSATLFCRFYWEFWFLRKTASLVFRTVRILSTAGTQLYLSCSQLCSELWDNYQERTDYDWMRK